MILINNKNGIGNIIAIIVAVIVAILFTLTLYFYIEDSLNVVWYSFVYIFMYSLLYYTYFKYIFYNKNYLLSRTLNSIYINNKLCFNLVEGNVKFVYQNFNGLNGVVLFFCVCYLEQSNTKKKHPLASFLSEKSCLQIVKKIQLEFPELVIEHKERSDLTDWNH
jgi:hypothetical protein